MAELNDSGGECETPKDDVLDSGAKERGDG
jgi:hypothetical protein